MYDPSVGRWLEEDPAEFETGDANLYRYVRNSAFSLTDPSGCAEKVSSVDIALKKDKSDVPDVAKRIPVPKFTNDRMTNPYGFPENYWDQLAGFRDIDKGIVTVRFMIVIQGTDLAKTKVNRYFQSTDKEASDPKPVYAKGADGKERRFKKGGFADEKCQADGPSESNLKTQTDVIVIFDSPGKAGLDKRDFPLLYERQYYLRVSSGDSKPKHLVEIWYDLELKMQKIDENPISVKFFVSRVKFDGIAVAVKLGQTHFEHPK